MKSEVLIEMSTSELKERLEQEQTQLLKLTMNHAVSPIENPLRIRTFKNAIARIKTELRKREISEKA